MALERPYVVSREALGAMLTRTGGALRFERLWVAGTLAPLKGPAVAIVGSRAPSDGARSRSHELARRLAQAGVCVVSGLALGIDGAAHAGALTGGGATVGVLGGAHDRFFPARNRALAEAMIAGGGAVVSPYEPGTQPRPFQFLQRNGIVAALVDAIVIVEAAARSGALNTAGWGADLGVDVLAFPGDVDRPKAAGCNALIRDGATLVRYAGDVLEALGRAAPAAFAAPFPDETTLGEGDDAVSRLVARALHVRGPLELEAIVALANLPAGDVLATLVRMEMAGTIEHRPGGIYARAERMHV